MDAVEKSTNDHEIGSTKMNNFKRISCGSAGMRLRLDNMCNKGSDWWLG